MTSGDEGGLSDSNMNRPKSASGHALTLEAGAGLSNKRPAWAVRHRIYLDNAIISCTTSAQRVGYHNFGDVLLREQIETRMYNAHYRQEAHFATRHAVLRFWHRDGTLSEKWMDKDYGGEKEHEFAMENMNDWTILHLSMGAEKATSDDEQEDDEETIDDSKGDVMEEEKEGTNDNDVGDADQDEDEVFPTMDITSHYLSSYTDARNIAGAPGVSSVSEDINLEDNDTESVEVKPSYHWLEERRRNLEHQFRQYYHCETASCFNKGSTCLVLGSQHLHVEVKDLTDWSQQIAHANRSISSTTLHLAAKLVDDQVRAQDERLADVGRERDDEDDLGEAIRLQPALGLMRPNQDDNVGLPHLDPLQ